MNEIKTEIIEKLCQVMAEYPYLRFGQILVAVFRTDKYDPFYTSDETMLNDLNKFLKKDETN